MTHTIRAQFIRYVFVGLALNAAFYGAYLLLTWWAMRDEAAMTITFSIGTLLSFLAHRSVTFRHRGERLAALRRFVTCYAILYLMDYLALWVFADRMGIPHQLIQACAAVVVALLAFVAQRYWVFPDEGSTAERIAARTS
ncbi:MAG: GtrA family protein [Mycobacterium sp.]|uniref:GtrA family protein n=1 Tax=Mycobacterium sp. TaxID=1785 RepID=UPI001EC8D798|nr:GtrA family protein [Mycobacterium sp.]MBW0017779.1 GtrA family protein [Mycobacterium sp.]